METTKLAAQDRPREQYRYRVSGTGTFPIDMLRYDRAYPANSEAVSAMAAGPWGETSVRRTVDLISHHRPTIDRWRSFGWLVED